MSGLTLCQRLTLPVVGPETAASGPPLRLDLDVLISCVGGDSTGREAAFRIHVDDARALAEGLTAAADRLERMREDATKVALLHRAST